MTPPLADCLGVGGHRLLPSDFMEWARPLYNRTQVKQAGKVIADAQVGSDEYERALAIVDNWRAAHAFPLNTLQMAVRRITKRVDSEVHPVQRLKRLPSIQQKLGRQPHMALTMMNDIGGLRAVVASVDDARSLQSQLLAARLESDLRDPYDYIEAPKPDGYRSVHFPFTYRSRKSPEWNGLRIEVQVRSQRQHAWATTVEVAALFSGQKFKWGKGDPRWLRFFALMSSAIARREECASVPGTPASPAAARAQLQELAHSLDVHNRLTAYSVVPDVLERHATGSDHFHLLRLDIAGGSLTVQSFRRSESQKAALEYAAAERAAALDPYIDVVLVAVDSVTELRRAYPNYFADTADFRDLLIEELQ